MKDRRRFTPGDLNKYGASGGGLRVPRTPVERIVLGAKLRKLKSDFERRQANRGR